MTITYQPISEGLLEQIAKKETRNEKESGIRYGMDFSYIEWKRVLTLDGWGDLDITPFLQFLKSISK